MGCGCYWHDKCYRGKARKEAEICYATIALSTDYDCWHVSEDDVTVEAVIQIIKQNVDTAKRIIRDAVLNIPKGGIAIARTPLRIHYDRPKAHPVKNKKEA